MQRIVRRAAARLMRVFSLVLLAALGCVVLMRYAPGYFTDSREMDAAYAVGARVQLSAMHDTQGSLLSLLHSQFGSWAHGDLGRSRHYNVPVTDLLRERSAATARLLLGGIGTGWLVALALALPLSARRGDRGGVWLAG